MLHILPTIAVWTHNWKHSINKWITNKYLNYCKQCKKIPGEKISIISDIGFKIISMDFHNHFRLLVQIQMLSADVCRISWNYISVCMCIYICVRVRACVMLQTTNKSVALSPCGITNCKSVIQPSMALALQGPALNEMCAGFRAMKWKQKSHCHLDLKPNDIWLLAIGAIQLKMHPSPLTPWRIMSRI